MPANAADVSKGLDLGTEACPHGDVRRTWISSTWHRHRSNGQRTCGSQPQREPFSLASTGARQPPAKTLSAGARSKALSKFSLAPVPDLARESVQRQVAHVHRCRHGPRESIGGRHRAAVVPARERGNRPAVLDFAPKSAYASQWGGVAVDRDG